MYTIPSYVIHNDKEIKGFFGDYHFLSNFFEPIKVRYKGIVYPSSECAYQAQKVVQESRHQFVDCTSSKSKKLWKNLPNNWICKEDWDDAKLDIMAIIVFSKFAQNIGLRSALLETSDKYLEETNAWKDTYFGVDYKSGLGENQLGKILMKVREFWKK